jgi:hypothetical protein
MEDMHQIKLKKDYIPGLGDSADLVAVGGLYDTKKCERREKRVFPGQLFTWFAWSTERWYCV